MAAADQTTRSAEEVARSYIEAISSHDVQAAIDHWHEDGIDDFVAQRVYRGTDEIRGFIQGLVDALPDLEMTVTRVTAGEQRAAVEWRLRGTFTGAPFEGVDPTGRTVELRGVDCMEVEEGRITSNTAYSDGAEFARAVGMLPPKESGAERAMLTAFNGATKLRAMVRDQMGR